MSQEHQPSQPGQKTNPQLMEKIVSLCKRRGFVFQSSEIYGGLNGCWDYGPLGVELKRNLKDFWWRRMTRDRDDVVGLDASILMNRAVWKASGHVDTFSDPMVDCLLTKQRFRADQVPAQSGIAFRYQGATDATPSAAALMALCHLDDGVITSSDAITSKDALRIGLGINEKRGFSIPSPDGSPQSVREFFITLAARLLQSPDSNDPNVQKFGQSYPIQNRQCDDEFSVLLRPKESETKVRKIAEDYYRSRGISLPVLFDERKEPIENTKGFNPENGAELTPPRAFNLMFKTNIGATEDENSIAYLRPETAQGIFVNFKNVLDTARKKIPFGIAQIGKAFRNEINPRNFIFRSREFEQMELEYFCRPEQGMDLLKYWLEERIRFYEDIGLSRDKIKVLDVPAEERAHYSKGTYDIEYEFPFGVQELEGVAYRTDYDLKQHQEHSGKPLEYFDEETKEKFIPHVVEPSAGVDRTVLALLCAAYAEETVTDDKGKSETRIVMRFHPRMAPIKCGVFPLLKNRPELVEKARGIAALLKPHMNVFYDETGAIGRRYRRQDEAGTPFGVTVDFETLGERGDELKDTVTLRHRDSMTQERIAIADLPAYLLAKIV